MTPIHATEAARIYVRARHGVEVPDPCIGFVICDAAGNIRGAVIFNDYCHRNIEMSAVAEPAALTVPVVRYLARYAFTHLACRRVSATTRPSNKRAIRALKALGFKPEGTRPDWFDDEDALIFGALARDTRLIRQ